MHHQIYAAVKKVKTNDEHQIRLKQVVHQQRRQRQVMHEQKGRDK